MDHMSAQSAFQEHAARAPHDLFDIQTTCTTTGGPPMVGIPEFKTKTQDPKHRAKLLTAEMSSDLSYEKCSHRISTPCPHVPTAEALKAMCDVSVSYNRCHKTHVVACAQPVRQEWSHGSGPIDHCHMEHPAPAPPPSPRWSTSHMTELDMHVTSHEMIVSATAMAPPFHGNLSIDLVSALRTTNPNCISIENN